MSEKIKKMQKSWNIWVKNNSSLYSAVGRPTNDSELEIITRNIIKKLILNKENKLLDVGCGSGVFLLKLKSFVKSVSGVDFSKEMIDIAKESIRDGNFYVSTSDNLPFDDNLFDRVLCYSVFHYFPNKKCARDTIMELTRVCSSGGYIYIGDVPSKRHYKMRENLVRKTKIFIKRLLKKFIAKLQNKSIPQGIYEKYYIHKPNSWMFYDLREICRYINSLGHRAIILEQPNNRQWNTTSHDYRFDIMIEKH